MDGETCSAFSGLDILFIAFEKMEFQLNFADQIACEDGRVNEEEGGRCLLTDNRKIH
jgi:hypothetical protein